MGRDFYSYLFSRFCAGTAMTMLRAAIAWHVFALSGSPFHLGLIGVVQFLPALLLSLVAGAVADAYDRRRILLFTQLMPFACALVLFLATRDGWVSLPLLYGCVFFVAISGAFDSPARAAMLPGLVPREVFPRAVTLSTTNQALAFVTGPALGGFLIAAGGVGAAYGAYAFLVVGAVGGLLFVRPVLATEHRSVVSWQAIREGVAFVRSQQVILGCMTLDMFAVIFGGATALLPIYANEILQVGPRGYGILASSLEVGAVLMSILLIFAPPIRNAGRALLITIAIFGLATIVFGFSRSFPLSLAAYMIAGMADQVSVVLRHTLIQLGTPDALRGRVSSVNMVFIGASNQLGAAESGFVAALTSAPFAVVSGGIGCLIVVLIVAFTMPRLYDARIGHSPS